MVLNATSNKEAEPWRNAFRVLHHELSNSLAPMLSLARTGRTMLERSPPPERLGVVLDTIADRAEHLRNFLERFSEIARLPPARPRRTEWRELLAKLEVLVAIRYEVSPPELCSEVDPALIEQLLINLVKNAIEAGSPSDEVIVQVHERPGGVRLVVRDRGIGMSADQLMRAREPFFTTKRGGSGLGLALAGEIAAAHRGELAITNRAGGGLEVAVSLPGTAQRSLGVTFR